MDSIKHSLLLFILHHNPLLIFLFVKLSEELKTKRKKNNAKEQARNQMEVSPVVSRVLTGAALAREAQSIKSP